MAADEQSYWMRIGSPNHLPVTSREHQIDSDRVIGPFEEIRLDNSSDAARPTNRPQLVSALYNPRMVGVILCIMCIVLATLIYYLVKRLQTYHDPSED